MHIPVKSLRPEDAELSKKLEELSTLQSRLAEFELQLLNLNLELAEFERLYFAKIGPLYSELDEIEALIAERIARMKPRDEKAAEAANVARKQAEESKKAVTETLSIPTRKATRSESLRDLYRAVAKRLHPDLSRDDADRQIRERLMTEANLAYEREDEARLRAILEEYDSSPDTVVGTDVAAELVRVIRRISLANKRIHQIEEEIVNVKSSNLCKLKALVDEGLVTGKDVLQEMVVRLKQQVQLRRDYLQTL